MLTKPTDTILSNAVWKNVNFIYKIIETWEHKIYFFKMSCIWASQNVK